MTKVLVAGGTGLVGSFLLRALSDFGEFEVTALARKARSLPLNLKNTQELVFDFDNANHYEKLAKENYAIVFCCLGTTRKLAGSDEKFRQVDLEYPTALLKSLKNTRPVYCLVSSVGADSPRGLYLQTKADLEKRIVSGGVPYVIVRPSLLLGERKEFRPLELFFVKTLGCMQNVMRNKLGLHMAKYAPIHASEVADALLQGALVSLREKRNLILEGRDLATHRSRL